MNSEEQDRIRKEVAETFGHKTERAFNPLTPDDLTKMPEPQKYEKEFNKKNDKIKEAFEKLRSPHSVKMPSSIEMPSLPLSVSGLNPSAKNYTPVKKGGMRKHTAKKHSKKHGGMRKHTAKKHSKKHGGVRKHTAKKHSKKHGGVRKHTAKKQSKKQSTKKHHKRK